MRQRVAYGRTGLNIELPDRADIIQPLPVIGLPDEKTALLDTLRQPIESPPLADLVTAGDRVVVVQPILARTSYCVSTSLTLDLPGHRLRLPASRVT